MKRIAAFCLVLSALLSGCATGPAPEPRFQSLERSSVGGRLYVIPGEQYRRESEQAPIPYNPAGRK